MPFFVNKIREKWVELKFYSDLTQNYIKRGEKTGDKQERQFPGRRTRRTYTIKRAVGAPAAPEAEMTSGVVFKPK